MITKSQIKQVINRAEAEYTDCWAFLASMKQGKLLQTPRMSITLFQSRLAATIFDLSRSYLEIARESTQRISNRNAYAKHWFSARMRFLSEQQELLNSTIAIGKGMGDAFAWFFYQRDRHYLAEHLAQPELFHVPSGIGGAGELEFVRHVSHFQGYFLIYHGNTNILRLGDLTLIDLKTFRVAGIGELKSNIVDNGKIEISMLISGPHINLKTTHAETRSQEPSSRKQIDIAAGLRPSARDRLRRQIQKIKTSYKTLASSPHKKLAIENDGYFEVLKDLVASLAPGKVSYRQAGKGLLLFGYREKRKTLYKKLSSPSNADWARKLSGVETYARDIIASDRDDNSIIIGTLYYGSDGKKTHHTPGMSHLMWWPLDVETIKGLVFHDIIVFTILNPVHLISAMERVGFKVEEISKLKYKISKRRDGIEIQVDGMDYYLRMIQQYLFSEDAIVSLITEVERQISNPKTGGPQRIEMLIEQRFGSRPL
jgi:hypothetical protein